MKIHYTVFLNRRGLTLESFLADVEDLKSALEKLENHSLFGYEIDELEYILRSRKGVVTPVVKKTIASKTSGKKAAETTKTSKTRKTRTRRRTTKKKSSEEKNSEKDDSGYFETWKVPYVEP